MATRGAYYLDARPLAVCNAGGPPHMGPAPLKRREALIGSALAFVKPASAETLPGQLVLGPLRVSAVGAGTWAWGNQFLYGYSSSEDEELRKAFDCLADGGINLLDTADSYGTGALSGRSESLLGSFSSSSSRPAGRTMQFATKFAAYPSRLSPDSIVDAARDSLVRLQRSSIDLGQLHWSTAGYAPWQEGALWEGVARCYELGLVKAIGVSNYGPKSLRAIATFMKDRGCPLVSNQVQYSLLSRVPEQTGLMETCREVGVQLIAYSPLCLGLLTGRYSKDNIPEGPRGVLFSNLLPSLGPLLSTLRRIAEAHGKSPSQVAVAWCISHGALPIPGVRTEKQAKDAVGCLTFRLTSDEVHELDLLSNALDKKGVKTIQNIFQVAEAPPLRGHY